MIGGIPSFNYRPPESARIVEMVSLHDQLGQVTKQRDRATQDAHRQRLNNRYLTDKWILHNYDDFTKGAYR